MVTTAPLGILDTLSAGFSIVNKRLWILLLPILLDLLLIFGPGVSVNPLVDEGLLLLQARAERALADAGGEVLVAEGSLPDAIEQFQQVVSAFQDVNFFGVLAWQIPSVLAATSSTPIIQLPELRGPASAEVSSGWVLLSYGLALALVSLLGISVYLAAIAQALRNEVFSAALLLRKAFVGWLSFSLFFAGLLLISVIGGGFLALLLGAASLFGPGGIAFASSIFLALALAASFYLFFVDDAIFMIEVWPLRAAWYSANVIWRNLWSALGFILLVNLILMGTVLVWGFAMKNPFGMAGAVLGHAYITTGFAAAGMLFFGQRFVLWQRAAAPETGPVNP